MKIEPSAHVSRRGGSFDASNYFQGVNPSAPNYGSLPPRQRSSSREFSAMGELSSVMGRPGLGPSSASARGLLRSQLVASPNASRHRRSMSDGMVKPPQPIPPPSLSEGLHQGNDPFIVPDPNYPSNRKLGATHGSIGSYSSLHSHHSFKGPPPSPGGRKGPPPSPGRGMHELGPEAEAFLAQQMGHPLRPVRPKTHMRQQSVNVYMKAFKGEKQPKSCKDVLFGVLFLLQLVVMFYVGLKFGPEAFVDSKTAKGLDDDQKLNPLLAKLHPLLAGDDTDHIELDYWNIVNMANVCGAFAIVVSALALAFMMAMSRNLVYVALVLSIGVSFAWGTIGIGIDPKSFVPITGIITLMLTVGYMFVVWDRIPFASANLTTALTGVGDNLGVVGIAFLFQFLALVCSICYSVAYVGLYDAMISGDVYSSDRAIILMHVLFLVSYYWTFQVLRVSDKLFPFVTFTRLAFLICSLFFGIFFLHNLFWTAYRHGHSCWYHWKLVVWPTFFSIRDIPPIYCI